MSDNNAGKTVAELRAEYEALWDTSEPTYVFDEENERVNVASSDEKAALVEGIESLFALAKAFERRVTALEEAPNYGRTVIDHEARMKALEATRESAQLISQPERDATRAHITYLTNTALLIADLALDGDMEGVRKHRANVRYAANRFKADRDENFARHIWPNRPAQPETTSQPAQQEAAAKAAPDTITLSRLQWAVVVDFFDRYGRMAAGMAFTISGKMMEEVAAFNEEVRQALPSIDPAAASSSAGASASETETPGQ